jgi:tyrosyl-tRNA synthetase
LSFYTELEWRGAISNATPGVDEALESGSVVGYVGFDPSADSLHAGSLLPILCLARMQKYGHTPIAIAGGGTGLVGDPSGKCDERQLLTTEQVEANLVGIKEQLGRFLDFECGENSALLLNNADWLCSMALMEFLRDVGKHFSVNTMIKKESVSRRIESEQGISFTEFGYMVLQAYDFLVLYDRYGCTLQMGGSDQWGNIVAGIDLIQRTRGGKAHGLVTPLLETASGAKFGKTEAGTVWLDAKRTSPYQFYQYWVNADDRDVVTYLRFFTWLSADEIGDLERSVASAPEEREAQRILARAVTGMVHGGEAAERAERSARLFFSGELDKLSASEIMDVLGDAPRTDVARSAFEGAGAELAEVLVTTGIAKSKGDARRTVEGGGIYLNSRRVTDPSVRLTLDTSIDGELFLLRKGKKNYHVVRIA